MTEEDFRGFYPGSKQPLPPVDSVDPDPSGPSETVWDARPLVKTVKGKPVEFFTIGSLATALHKAPVTIRLWISKGYLPAATYRLPTQGAAGRRLYTRAQIEALVALATKHGIIDQQRVRWNNHPTFSVEAREAWKGLTL